MKYLRSLGRRLNDLTNGTACWGVVVFAAAPKVNEPGSATQSAWVLPYLLVIMFIGLGLLGVVRSSRRRDRAKPETYSGTGIGGDDE